ncbi:helix-hairpin-helix domain-containing protein [Aquimarina sp. 2-A2]|uniref:helix-hairpin-helix domain-containing protein n=1 Tax=Aquimarina sp. 2-A2 TaxID=3382644 RepID=UPI00387F0CC6
MRIKSHFEMNYRFRNGIFVFSVVLFVYSLFIYFFKTTNDSNLSFTLDKEHQSYIDSLKCVATQEKQSKRWLKPFNPNFISDYKGYVLGLSPEHLERLRSYRAKGQWVNSPAEFKKVTLIPDSLLIQIAPLFKFPIFKHVQKRTQKSVLSFDQKKELNTVTSETLITELNIPDFIAERIVKYRKGIGGFVSDKQLEDVHGLYARQRTTILSHYTVKQSPLKKRIVLSGASVKDLMKVPYIDFESAIRIRDYQKANGNIKDFKELEKIGEFHFEKIDKIALYLTIK